MSSRNLWITRCPVPTASSIAFDRGLLGDELAAVGFSVSSLQDSADPAIREAHFHHRLDGLIREGGNTPALWARSAGADTRLVALTWVDEYQAILTLDPGIDSPAALAGRRLAIPRNPEATIDFWAAMALRGFEAALGLADLGLEDAELVPLAGDRNQTGWGPGKRARFGMWDPELDALAAGEVDAIYVKGAPGVSAARGPGIHEVVEFGSHPDPRVRVNNGTPRTITASADLLEEEGLVARFLAVLLGAAEWAAENEGELARVIASETGESAERVKAAYGSARLHPDLRDDWLDALEEQRRSLLAHGLQEGDFDLRSWVDPGPLAEARRIRREAGVGAAA